MRTHLDEQNLEGTTAAPANEIVTNGTTGIRQDLLKVTDTKQLNAERRSAIKGHIGRQQLSIEQVVEKLNIRADERIGWQQYLGSVLSDTQVTTVPPERAKVLAPALGVEIMDLLIRCTDIEQQRLGGVPMSSPKISDLPLVVSTMPKNELQKQRGNALDALMAQQQLSANQLAAMVETDEYEISVLAMNIAEYRQGEQLMPAELCKKIADILQLDPASLYIELLAEEAISNRTMPIPSSIETTSPPTGDQRRRMGRPPGSKNRSTPKPAEQAAPIHPEESTAKTDTALGSPPPEAVAPPSSEKIQDAPPARRGRKPGPRPGTTGGADTSNTISRTETPRESISPEETVLTTLALSSEALHSLLGGTVEIVKKTNGRYTARLPEKSLTKDDVIDLLARR